MSAYWIGDQNNPNRDLSDPSWVSVEGARAMRNINRSNRSLHETRKECEHEKTTKIKGSLISDKQKGKLFFVCQKCLKVIKIE